MNTESIGIHNLFRGTAIKEGDIRDIFGAYIVAKKNADSAEAARLFVSALIIKLLLKGYKQLKAQYANHLSDEKQREDGRLDAFLDKFNEYKEEAERVRLEEKAAYEEEIKKLKAKLSEYEGSRTRKRND